MKHLRALGIFVFVLFVVSCVPVANSNLFRTNTGEWCSRSTGECWRDMTQEEFQVWLKAYCLKHPDDGACIEPHTYVWTDLPKESDQPDTSEPTASIDPSPSPGPGTDPDPSPGPGPSDNGDDGNNGHGNDPSGNDPSNPGQGHGPHGSNQGQGHAHGHNK